jgi:hypothetical protein
MVYINEGSGGEEDWDGDDMMLIKDDERERE